MVRCTSSPSELCAVICTLPFDGVPRDFNRTRSINAARRDDVGVWGIRESRRGVSGVIGRLKGTSSSRFTGEGDSGRAATRVEEGVGNGMAATLLGLRAVAWRRSRASADVGVELLVAGNRGSAEYGILGTGDGVGEDARDTCRCLARSLVCSCG